jgi:hypothetical protein
MEQRRVTAVLFSGGWESTACAVNAWRYIAPLFDLVFFDYGQPYLEQEVRSTAAIAGLLEQPLVVSHIDEMVADEHGVFADRNATFIRKACELGYRELYFGCRSPVSWSWVDRWGDSNVEFVAEMEREQRCVIRTPCLCKPKWFLRWYIRTFGPPGVAEAVWSSEGWNYEKEAVGADAHHTAV